MRDLDRGIELFKDVLDEVVEQVTSGKGEERHGHGDKLLEQHWRQLAKAHGIGFLTGQAEKKIREAASMRGKPGYTAIQYEKEMMGAVAYITFALMYQREVDGAAEEGTPLPIIMNRRHTDILFGYEGPVTGEMLTSVAGGAVCAGLAANMPMQGAGNGRQAVTKC